MLLSEMSRVSRRAKQVTHSGMTLMKFWLTSRMRNFCKDFKSSRKSWSCARFKRSSCKFGISANAGGGGKRAGTPLKSSTVSFATASKVLSLPKKNLSEIPPAAWEGADITTLDLSHNQIKVLPTELAMCSALEVR